MTLQELIGVPLPIIQAPMAGAQDSKLAIAVSEAGGLGSIPCAMLAASALKRELEALKAGTRKPFNVNFFCHEQPKPDADRETRWRKALAPYYKELGVDPGAIPSGPGRMPFNDEAAALVEEFRPPVVSFHFGLPAQDLLDRVKSTGAKVLSSATTVEEARWLEARGVDAVIAQGAEAGGHRGSFLAPEPKERLGTWTLVARLLESIKVPVIASGGIGTPDEVAKALKLGAAGVQLGTAYLLCPESTTNTVHRKALKSPGAKNTMFTNVFSGRAARGIMNRAMRELGPMSDLAPAFPLASAAIAPLRAKAESQGSGDFSPLWCGQNSDAAQAIPAAELTLQLSGR